MGLSVGWIYSVNLQASVTPLRYGWYSLPYNAMRVWHSMFMRLSNYFQQVFLIIRLRLLILKVLFTGYHKSVFCCYFYCLTLLTSTVGWDSMRYESELLTSYRWLMNCPYTIILIWNFSPCHPTSLSAPSMVLSPSSSRVRSWSHHWKNLIKPFILSAPVHSS